MQVPDLLCGAHRAFMGLELSHLRGDRNPQMDESLSGQIDALRALTLQQLRHKHVELFGEPCGSRHRQQVVRRIGWRLQVLAEGGLSERAHRRALEIADDADLRTLPPNRSGEDPTAQKLASVLSAKDRRVPEPGAVLIREFKGKRISVTVLEHGFECNGRVFKSLSAVARHATGTAWNGYAFFRLSL
jgi:hypothetical protein